MNGLTASELFHGEKILWEGRSNRGIIFRPIDFFLIPFSLMWAGFVIFWNASVWMDGAGLFFKLFGLTFLFLGIYFTFGRFLLDAMIRNRSVYFVTDKRVIIKNRFGGSQTKSLDIKRLPALKLDERADGVGTIRFDAANSWFGGNNFGIWQPTFDSTPQFIRIPDVRLFFELIQKQSEAV